jgi:hypothetical protein
MAIAETAASRSTPRIVMPVPQAPALPNKEKQYQGFGGWLAFFCVMQVFVAPIVTLGLTFVTLFGDGFSRLVEQYPGVGLAVFLGSAGDVALAVFGIYAGVGLVGLRTGAVRIAKRYLVGRLLWALAALAFPYLADAPREIVSAMSMETLKGLLRTLFVFAIWYSYFNVSKRIKQTFPNG